MISKKTIFFVLVVLAARSAPGDDLPPGDDPPPTRAPKLLFLQLAKADERAKREVRFADELAMILEGVTVASMHPENAKFNSLTLGEQISSLRPMMDTSGAVAAIWMTEPLPDQLLLHLVVISTGRALVRLIEIEAVEGFEADLALSARELLGTAFLFEAVPETESESLNRVVESVREEAARPLGERRQPGNVPEPTPDPTAGVVETDAEEKEAEPAVPPQEEDSKGDWAVWATLYLEGGLAGARGPSLLLGTVLALERRFTAGFSAYLSFGLAGGPLESTSRNIQIASLDVAPGLGALYLWHFDRFALGPGFRVHAKWSNVGIEVEREGTQVFRAWQIRGSLTLEARLRVLEFMSVAGAIGMVVTPEKDVYQLDDTNEVIMATPRLSYLVQLGLVFFF